MLSFAFIKKIKKRLEQCPEEFKPIYLWRYVDDIFVVLRSPDHRIKFRDYLHKCYPNTEFSFEEEKNGNKFVTTVYCKPTFSCIAFYLLHINLV